MTELTVVRAPIEHDTMRHSWPRRMARVTWVQHKTGLVSIAALFAVFAIVLVVTGQVPHHAYAEYLANSCLSTLVPAQHLAKCGTIHDTLSAQYGSETNIVMWATRALTLLAAVFLGVPLLSRELESGSYRFAWSQGIGRVRWALLKTTLLGLALMIMTFALSVALSWYLTPFNGAGFTNRWIPDDFDITYLSLALWAGLAFFVSVLIGALARKVIPAMAAAMATVAVLVVLAFVYVDKWILSINARVFRIPINQGYGPNTGTINTASGVGVAGPRGAWMLHGWITTRSGTVLDKAQTFTLLTRAETAVQGSTNKHAVNVWLAAHHYASWNTYQPANHYWPLQIGYAVGLLACLLIVVAATAWAVHRVGSGSLVRGAFSTLVDRPGRNRSKGTHATSPNRSTRQFETSKEMASRLE
jgi:hypothetical protein